MYYICVGNERTIKKKAFFVTVSLETAEDDRFYDYYYYCEPSSHHRDRTALLFDDGFIYFVFDAMVYYYNLTALHVFLLSSIVIRSINREPYKLQECCSALEMYIL